MRKVILFLFAAVLLLSSCADSKTFKKSDGTEFVANPYGWMTKEKEVEGVNYEICTGNVVWSFVLSETIVAPVLITGLALYEPVSYNEPKEEK